MNYSINQSSFCHDDIIYDICGDYVLISRILSHVSIIRILKYVTYNNRVYILNENLSPSLFVNLYNLYNLEWIDVDCNCTEISSHDGILYGEMGGYRMSLKFIPPQYPFRHIKVPGYCSYVPYCVLYSTHINKLYIYNMKQLDLPKNIKTVIYNNNLIFKHIDGKYKIISK